VEQSCERAVEFQAPDGVILRGHYWPARGGAPMAGVIVNAATGVQASYYHRYAAFLARQGFNVLTYDYRGIGASRPARLRGCGYTWREWGELDFSAALGTLQGMGDAPVHVVGHSIGGILPGLSAGAPAVRRLLTVGAQYAWWPDYAASQRGKLFLKWHLLMPLLTALMGYFPGRRLGWLEDLPKGVALEWSFRGARMERSYPAGRRDEVLSRFEAVRSAILAVAATDDEFATRAAVRRGLSYFQNAERTFVALAPADLGMTRIGHFDLFHARHEDGFWRASAAWLATGVNPWPEKVASITPDRRATGSGTESALRSRRTAWRSFQVSRATAKSLANVLEQDDHLLNDVGLTRDQLCRELKKFGADGATLPESDKKAARAPHDSPW